MKDLFMKTITSDDIDRIFDIVKLNDDSVGIAALGERLLFPNVL